jgi:HK97 family phage major capsid protein
VDPKSAAEGVAEGASQAQINALADHVADRLGKQFGDMQKEYRAQAAEAAQKALEGKPEEASAQDPTNIFKGVSPYEWLEKMGQVVGLKEASEGGQSAIKSLCYAYAAGIESDSVNVHKGLEKAEKSGKLGANGEFVAKALGANDFSAGGALVDQQLAAEVIPALLSETGVFGDPSIMVIPVNGQLDIPYEVSGPTARWVAENAAANASEPSFNQTTLRTERISIVVPSAKKLFRNTALAAAAVETSIRRQFNDAVDSKFIRSVGASNTPIGLRYLADSSNVLTVQTTVSAANTDKDLLRLFQQIQSNNVPENLSVTDSSETEIYLYETSGLRIGIGDEMTMVKSDVAAYNDSSGTVQAPLSRDQIVTAVNAEVGLTEVYRGLGIAVLSDVDWGV